ncbi:hypothetical protein [endosymbiont 'TC1' of Trimyema compressum]|uniref:hypothetical protein n=1 Tax=endosymbiont 'TC1' of Trimyema compressum TaxID=243899 RepID=UPI0013922C87|nr:hypothetical protein [endosymbiont 'TC1' of Trimyema compressum]
MLYQWTGLEVMIVVENSIYGVPKSIESLPFNPEFWIKRIVVGKMEMRIFIVTPTKIIR